jgi:hypothetical protein
MAMAGGALNSIVEAAQKILIRELTLVPALAYWPYSQ